MAYNTTPEQERRITAALRDARSRGIITTDAQESAWHRRLVMNFDIMAPILSRSGDRPRRRNLNPRATWRGEPLSTARRDAMRLAGWSDARIDQHARHLLRERR